VLLFVNQRTWLFIAADGKIASVMKLIIGLGNPGEKYRYTRHSVGLVVVEKLSKLKLPKNVIVKESGLFMNLSGVFVRSQLAKYHIKESDLYVIHDDLDIPLGSYKIQFGVGPKVHNGINSIESELGTKDFWRVRVGIENRKSGENILGEEYVLENFSVEEKKILDSVVNKICDDLSDKLTHR
jgi:PTH1 family peptidyl-tRNA hydrolase